jgi:hypothetical protein
MSYAPDEYDRGPADQGVQTPEAKLRERRQSDPRGPVRRPAGAAAPADHLPPMKALGTKPVEVQFEGRSWLVVPTILDDWEFVEKQLDGTLDPNDLPAQYRAMLGDEGYDELKEHVRSVYGYVSARVLGSFMQAVQERIDSGN